MLSYYQTTLFEDGLEQLNSSFRELLKQHSQRVPDGILIDIANASTEEGRYILLYVLMYVIIDCVEIPPLEHLPRMITLYTTVHYSSVVSLYRSSC